MDIGHIGDWTALPASFLLPVAVLWLVAPPLLPASLMPAFLYSAKELGEFEIAYFPRLSFNKRKKATALRTAATT